MKKLLGIVVLGLLWCNILSAATKCYEDQIVTPGRFRGVNGEIFKLSNNTYWEIKFEYAHLSKFRPKVTMCETGTFSGYIIIDGKKLKVKRKR